MNGRPPSPTYLVYVLRLWQEQPEAADEAAVWRCSLENPDTRQRRGFADLPALAAYLQSTTAPPRSPQPRPSQRRRHGRLPTTKNEK